MSQGSDTEVAREKLTPEQVKPRIREGRTRRAHLKKGTFKRLLGGSHAWSSVGSCSFLIPGAPGCLRDMQWGSADFVFFLTMGLAYFRACYGRK